MSYFVFIVSLVATAVARRRSLSQPYSLPLKAFCLILTLAPVVGPVFYLIIDPPESSPSAVAPEDFWLPTKGAGRVWPDFKSLKVAISSIWKGPTKPSE